MRIKLFCSWIALLAGMVYGANLSYDKLVEADPLASALSGGYLFWALYWGVPITWRWWWRVSPRRRAQTVSGSVFWFAVDLTLPVILGYFYGVFGGGLYECWKTWMSVRRSRVAAR